MEHYHTEVSLVESRNGVSYGALGHRHHDRVHETETTIGILAGQLVRAIKIGIDAPIDPVQTLREVRLTQRRGLVRSLARCAAVRVATGSLVESQLSPI